MAVVLVSGGSRGLGSAIIAQLVQRGARVVTIARSGELLNALRQKLGEGNVEIVVGDITDQHVREEGISRALAVYGRLDAIINNAGSLEPLARIENTTAEQWKNSIDVNLISAISLTQLAIPHLRATQGRVINVSSGAALKPVTAWAAYCCGKAALHMFTEALALEEPQIVAISVRPGVVDTEMQSTIRSKGSEVMGADYARFPELYSAGKLLKPEQPAAIIARLALEAPNEWSGKYFSWDDPRTEAWRAA